MIVRFRSSFWPNTTQWVITCVIRGRQDSILLNCCRYFICSHSDEVIFHEQLHIKSVWLSDIIYQRTLRQSLISLNLTNNCSSFKSIPLHRIICSGYPVNDFNEYARHIGLYKANKTYILYSLSETTNNHVINSRPNVSTETSEKLCCLRLSHVINLYHSMGRFSSRQKWWYLFYFSKKIGFDISYKLSPKETICMKYQNLFFFLKSKENYFKISSAENVIPSMFLSVKYLWRVICLAGSWSTYATTSCCTHPVVVYTLKTRPDMFLLLNIHTLIYEQYHFTAY